LAIAATYIIAESGGVYHMDPQFFTPMATFCKFN